MPDNGNPDRKQRPEPARTGPDRAGWSNDASPSEPEPQAATTSPEVCQVVADAVRVGYEVIGRNLADGRAAADRFRAGSYQADDVPTDVMRMGRRLLQLSRDLSATGFDLLAAVLRDPGLHAAIQPGQRKSAEPDLEAPDRVASAKPLSPTSVTYVFRGRRRATGAPTTLQPPDAPTILSISGLEPVSGEGAPITQVSFSPAQLGRGIVAIITIADQQPAGAYAGIVRDAATGATLGRLDIEVLTETAGDQPA